MVSNSRDKCCTMFYIFLLGHFYKSWYDINLAPAFCSLEVFSVNRNCHQLTVAAMGTWKTTSHCKDTNTFWQLYLHRSDCLYQHTKRYFLGPKQGFLPARGQYLFTVTHFSANTPLMWSTCSCDLTFSPRIYVLNESHAKRNVYKAA